MAKPSLSRLAAFVLGYEATQFRVGVDVHKKSYSLAQLREDGACLIWTGPARAETPPPSGGVRQVRAFIPPAVSMLGAGQREKT